MKRFGIFLAFVFALSVLPATAHTYGDPGNGVSCIIKPTGEKTFKLQLVNLKEQRATITIENLEGTTSYYREIVKNHNGYARNIDIKNLPAGKYLLTVQTKDQKITRVIAVKPDIFRVSGLTT
jgi:hypothetical protein